MPGADVATEWDRNAEARCRQIASGLDISHDLVLLPAITKAVGSVSRKRILDIGSGCGFLSAQLARSARLVVGIDISNRMVLQARMRFHAQHNLKFARVSIQRFASRDRPFDVCVSNMSLMTIPDIGAALSGIRRSLKPGGLLVFSVAHPCFWNLYRNDEAQRSFRYSRIHRVTAQFRISLDQKPLPARTTYIHRPLESYFAMLRKAHFTIKHVLEPEPPTTAPRIYREGFRFPRFMVFSCVQC